MTRTAAAAETWTPEFRELVRTYEDTAEHHGRMWTRFFALANRVSCLRYHRDFVEFFDYGFGDRPFHYQWKLLVEQMKQEFSFLEVGVYKGQVVSLILLLARELGKTASVFGITPLSSRGDKYSRYPDLDYGDAIDGIFQAFRLPRRQLKLIRGLSTDPDAAAQASEFALFGMVYIDGGHDYDVVTNDIRTYGPMVKSGGFLIMDDASCNLCLPDMYELPKSRAVWPSFKGHKDVSRAVRDILEPNPEFSPLFACGHNRVWLRH